MAEEERRREAEKSSMMFESGNFLLRYSTATTNDGEKKFKNNFQQCNFLASLSSGQAGRNWISRAE
jgi:hypothetical protein